MIGARPSRLTGGQIVAAWLQESGLTIAFSLPGSQVLPIWDGLDRLDVVVPRSERDAAFMAEGFGRATGTPAVVLSTLGPGVANELPGLRSAQLSRTPVVCVAPWQPPWKRERLSEVFQGLDQPTFFADVCKCREVVDDAADIPLALARACTAATRDPMGPARVDISFPLLFARHGVPAFSPHRPGRERSLPERIRIRETGRPDGNVWVPGSSSSGHAVAFAVGAKLACPGSHVTVETSRHHVDVNLGALAVARARGVDVQLVGCDCGDILNALGSGCAPEAGGPPLTVVVSENEAP